MARFNLPRRSPSIFSQPFHNLSVLACTGLMRSTSFEKIGTRSSVSLAAKTYGTYRAVIIVLGKGGICRTAHSNWISKGTEI
jgi:hypothetical protein